MLLHEQVVSECHAQIFCLQGKQNISVSYVNGGWVRVWERGSVKEVHMKQRRPVPSWGIPHQSWSALASSLMSGWVLWSHRGTRFLVMSQKRSVGTALAMGESWFSQTAGELGQHVPNGVFRCLADGHRAQQQANDTVSLVEPSDISLADVELCPPPPPPPPPLLWSESE